MPVSRRTFLSGATAAVASAGMPGQASKAVAALVAPLPAPTLAATPEIEFMPHGLKRGRETIYAVYELLKDGLIRVSEDRHPPGEITSYWAHGLGASFDLQGRASDGAYFDIPPGHERYEEIVSAISDGKRMEAEAERNRVARTFANAGFPLGQQQAIDKALARHAKKFRKAARPIPETVWCSTHGGCVSVSFDDERGYHWGYSRVTLGRQSGSVSIEAVLDDEKLAALADYFEEHGTDAEKQALVIKPAERWPGGRQRFAPPPTRKSIAEKLLIDRAGSYVANGADYARFDKVVQELLAGAEKVKAARLADGL